MDIATVVGLLLGTGLVLGSILLSAGGGLAPFIDIPSMMITMGGSVSAILINFPLGNVLGVAKVVKNCFLNKLPTPNEVIEQFKEFAAIVRKDGILALENSIPEIHDPFLKRGMEMVVGGNSRDDIQSVLEVEISYIEQRHQSGKKILEAMGAAAPAFGMIGTLIGLVQMLRTLDDPSKIGGGMATALLTTLYGALAANLFCIPLAGKLDARNNEEMMVRDLMTAGLVSLVDGQTPRALEERLMAYISPHSRRVVEDAA
jgi:chemotaxis protein MotA